MELWFVVLLSLVLLALAAFCMDIAVNSMQVDRISEAVIMFFGYVTLFLVALFVLQGAVGLFFGMVGCIAVTAIMHWWIYGIRKGIREWDEMCEAFKSKSTDGL